ELETVEGLRAGRSKARETAPVRPVPTSIVEKTLPKLRPQVAAMVQLQLETAMRPGEVTIMRPIDLNMKGKIWLCTPSDLPPFSVPGVVGVAGLRVFSPWACRKGC